MENTKKWFIYLGDHHEGPFPDSEVVDKARNKIVTAATYVWHEGMEDWVLIKDAPELWAQLRPILEPNIDLSHELLPEGKLPEFNPTQGATESQNSSETLPEVSPASEAEMPVETATVSKISDFSSESSHGKNSKKISTNSTKTPKTRLIALLFLLATSALFFVFLSSDYPKTLASSPAFKAFVHWADDSLHPYVLKAVESFPGISQWVSPIPHPDGISDADFNELKQAAIGDPLKTGPRIAIIPSLTDPLKPRFYIASNLPDSTQLEVYVVGNVDTLLNQLGFEGKVQAVSLKRLAQSTALMQADGRPIPKGEYSLYAVNAERQPEAVSAILNLLPTSTLKTPPGVPKARKIVSQKTLFLGGPKDAAYISRLKEFHDKIKARAVQELGEIQQFLTTLEAQNGTTQAETKRLRALRNPKQAAKLWSDFSIKWMQLDAQIKEASVKWTPETLQAEYFYSELYTLVTQVLTSVERLHQMESQLFSQKKVDQSAFDIQYGEASSQTQLALNNLRSRYEYFEKLPPTPAGLPRRDSNGQ